MIINNLYVGTNAALCAILDGANGGARERFFLPAEIDKMPELWYNKKIISYHSAAGSAVGTDLPE